MTAGTPCEPEPITMNANTVPGTLVEATDRHFVEFKLTRNKIYVNFGTKCLTCLNSFTTQE